ncbi:MAG: hypothetical protein ACOC44_17860 [Promethearchaeia archaeon]
MPYQRGKRLPGERGSKIGHLEVIESELVQNLMSKFQINSPPRITTKPKFSSYKSTGKPLSIVFGIDGSLQILESETSPRKKVAFVKTALLKLDQHALSKIDQNAPNPFSLRDVLSDSAVYHATVFPMKNVMLPDTNTYDGIRKIIFDSLQDKSLQGEPYKTLKWILYEKWSGEQKSLKDVHCPQCEEYEGVFKYDADVGKCSNCNGDIYFSDVLGFHIDMDPDFAPDTVAISYMNIHELLLLFTGIRVFWQQNKKILSECLFVRDGPLYLRYHYKVLLKPIRRFFQHAIDKSVPIHIISQEKTGKFADHLEILDKLMKPGEIFIPEEDYLYREILQRRRKVKPYGEDSNLGSKIFIKLSDYHKMILNIPIWKENPQVSDLVGFDRIMATLPNILSCRHEGALLPVELAHGIASLSTYPSAKILKIFSHAQGINC